ncbi:MAG TPA: endonuclease/exonuclease/phosphatase family protein [Lysobacter sp.]|nr:endonuclease/exonuclease/phosphatase family protein [Lysobacter sp.]
MSPFWRLGLLALGIVLVLGCVRTRVYGDPRAAATVRVATFNASLYEETAGGLIRRLQGDDAHARRIAAILQRVRPDIVLINEFDYDPAGRAADLFQRRYLEVAQHGGEPLRYGYRFLAPVNTGVPSGLDLDGSGELGRDDRARGEDAWGYGLHPGQYGMLLLSRYPIDAATARTFQHLRWNTMPGARRPRSPDGRVFHPDTVWTQLRLSSKSHWDVPVETPLGRLHVLAAHPTPPVFDGPENRNGARNFDEIRLWAEYLDGGAKRWLCDDQGRCGGLGAGARFVIVGDLNADPHDGEGEPGAVAQLLAHPRVNPVAPRSRAAAARATQYGLPRRGDPSTHTADFGPRTGTLRVDYVLPSRELRVVDHGVFWPAPDEPDAALAAASDHSLVWVELARE